MDLGIVLAREARRKMREFVKKTDSMIIDLMPLTHAEVLWLASKKGKRIRLVFAKTGSRKEKTHDVSKTVLEVKAMGIETKGVE